MTQNLIQSANAATPWWMMEIQDYNALEVHPVYREIDLETGDYMYETCKPEQAHLWSVYGHSKQGGLHCFEDFPTQEEAYAFAERLLKGYSHLQEYGLS